MTTKYKIVSTPDCCWRYIRGVNSGPFDREALKIAVAKTSKGTALRPNRWIRPAFNKIYGGLLFCGAFGGNTPLGGLYYAKNVRTINAVHKDKLDAQKAVNYICDFFEEENLGEIIEIENFTNHNHNSTIIPRLVTLYRTFDDVIHKWYKEWHKKGYIKRYDTIHYEQMTIEILDKHTENKWKIL
jgi:hypothetical protein